MKLEIDTKKKTIFINEKVNLKDFYDDIRELLKDWDTYNIISREKIQLVQKEVNPFTPNEDIFTPPFPNITC